MTSSSTSTTSPLASGVAALLDLEVADLEVRRSPYSSTAPLFEIEVSGGGHAAHRLIVKDLWRPVRQDKASRPAFVEDPEREPRVYQHLLRPDLHGTARWFGTVNENGRPRWLVLGHIEGLRLEHCGDLRLWESAAAWLGRFHRLSPSASPLVTLPLHDAAWFERWAHRAHSHVGPGAPRWLRAYDPIARHLAALDRHLVHGDFTPGNLLVHRSGVCPVDWESAAHGPGLLDLASLITGWGTAASNRMVAAYASTAGASVDPLDLSIARLQMCVQWLGWSDLAWGPEEKQRDWLSEACALAERLGL